MRIAVIAAGLVMIGGAAFADEPPAAAKPVKEKVICKERTKANSRFTTRSCMTQKEWDAQTETARSAFAEVQNRPYINIERGN
ncbi:MAG TPA: hypothetical protein VF138_09850 [Caulobacteraceae bacterium]